MKNPAGESWNDDKKGGEIEGAGGKLVPLLTACSRMAGGGLGRMQFSVLYDFDQ